MLATLGCETTPRTSYLSPEALPETWRLHAERTNYDETGRYDEAVSFCRRLAAASPYARYLTFGVSGEGRALPLLVLSTDAAFTPAAAQQSRKPLVLVQNCIHAGECEGKDASLALARDIIITGTQADLLAHVNVLIIPIYNVDGHERRSLYGRINQNGPREMGWRTNATNLNLNRDYVKADAVETQAWLRLWNAWQPDLFIDTHTTDGERHRYDLFYDATQGPETAEPVARWVRAQLLPDVLAALTADGYATLPYGQLRDRKAPTEGYMAGWSMSPRFSTGYPAACNRPALLVETYSWNPYARRVRATYDFLRHTLSTLGARPQTLRAAIRAADAQCVAAHGGGDDGRVALAFAHTDQHHPVTYHAYQQVLHESEITGDPVIEYTQTPLDVEIPLFDGIEPTFAVTPPAAYLIPPQWSDAIQRLEVHGIRFFRLRQAHDLDVESHRFDDVSFTDRPHEGRQLPHYQSTSIRERRHFVAGTVVVPLDQPRAKLAVNLLEPAGPDSLVAWGLFNAIFEQKEYAEAYVMEPLARQMSAEDAALRREFAERLAWDEAFARNPQQRLDFFYRRSPYADARQNVYPVARVGEAGVVQRLKAE